MVWGLVRWVFENSIQGYTVIIVAVNRRIAVNIYKYLVGAWNALYEQAREQLYITREDLRRRLRIRLYLGGEHSCLQGRKKHYIEHCLACPLYQRHSREWRRPPATPFMDPWMLKMAGYCPFIAAFSKNYYYNSIVVTTLDSLPFLLANVRRNNIRKVVVVFDEYLEALQRMKPRIRLVDARRALRRVDSREVERLVDEWNKYVKLLDLTLASIHERKIVEWLERTPGDPLEIMAYMYTHMRDNLRREEEILEILEEMRRVVERLEEAADRLKIREKLIVKRLAKKLKGSLGVWVTFTGWGTGKPVDKLLLRWSNGSIVGPPGGRITQMIEELVKDDVMVAVVTTSVLSSRIASVARSIPPHKTLEHVPIHVTRYKRVIVFNIVNINPVKQLGRVIAVDAGFVEFFIDRLERMKGNDVVIVNKTIFKHLVQTLGDRVELAGDPERGVYDYAVAKKDNGGVILLIYAHGRVIMKDTLALRNIRLLSTV